MYESLKHRLSAAIFRGGDVARTSRLMAFGMIGIVLLNLIAIAIETASYQTVSLGLHVVMLILMMGIWLLSRYRSYILLNRSDTFKIRIAQQEREQESLRNSEQLYRGLLDASPDAIAISDKEGHLIKANHAAAQLLGYADVDEMLATVSLGLELFLPEEYEQLLETSQIHLEQKSKSFVVEHTVRRRDGSTLLAEINIALIIDEQGAHLYSISTARDITARKQAEEALKREHRLLQSVFDTSVAAITVLDTQGNIMLANDGAKKVLGIQRSEIENRRYDSPQWKSTDFEGEPWPDEKQPFVRILTTGEPVEDVQHAIEWPDGTRKYLSINGAPIKDSDGQMTNITFTVYDITEQYLAEKALRDSEKRFQQIVSTIDDVFYLIDIKTRRFIYVSPAYEKIWQQDPTELFHDAMAFQRFTHPDDLERVNSERQRMWSTLSESELEYRIMRPDGQIRWVYYHVYPYSGEQGKPMLFVGTSQDITRRKLAEESLRESEERYRIVSDLIWSYACAYHYLDDGQATLEWVIGAFEQITGHTIAEAMNNFTIGSPVYADDIQIFKNRHEKLRAGQPDTSEFRIVSKKGEVRWVRSYGLPEWDATYEKVKRVYVGVQDISEQKRAEQALRQNEQLLKAVLDSLPANVFVTDGDSRIVFSGGRLLQSLDSDPESLIGQSIFDLYVNNDTFVADMRQALAGRRIEKERPYGDALYMTYLIPQVDDAGHVTRVVGTSFDITERKEAEQHRVEIILQKERIDLLNQFISDLSHDLKTPLSVINTSLYLLGKYSDPENQQRKLNTIRQQAQHLERIIEDILFISRLEHAPQLESDKVDIAYLLTTIETRLRETAEKKGINLQLLIDDTLAPIRGDDEQFQRALINIVENAILYTPENGNVLIRATQRAETLEIEIQDSGIGISPQDLPYIFDRFYRADKARSVEKGGTGLGLAIARRVIELHHGRIEVESIVGQGTTFTIFMPVAVQV